MLDSVIYLMEWGRDLALIALGLALLPVLMRPWSTLIFYRELVGKAVRWAWSRSASPDKQPTRR